jgi:hypothetical protein
VKSRKGIFEFLLGGSVYTKLLDIRIFETPVKRATYAKQTQAAEGKGESNCPLLKFTKKDGTRVKFEANVPTKVPVHVKFKADPDKKR